MADSLTIVNAIRDVAGSDYQARIPQATRENIASVGNTILSYAPNTNLFLTQLINRIGRVVIDRMDSMDDIYAVFGDERLEWGDTIQKIFVDIPSAKAYDNQFTNPSTMLQVEKGLIHVEYTSVDRRLFYKTTISEAQLKEAFLTVAKLDDFISALVDAMGVALSYDKYVMLTNTLYEHCKYAFLVHEGELTGQVNHNVNALIVPESVAKYNKTEGKIEWNTVGAKVFLKLIRVASRGLKFPHALTYLKIDGSDAENEGQITRVRTPISRQVCALEVSTMAEIDIEALAVLFNIAKADIETRLLELEDGALGLVTGNASGDPEFYIGGFIADKDAVVRGTSFEEKDSFKNPEYLYVNLWQHYWGYMAISKFKDFVPICFSAYTPASEANASEE